MAISPAPSLTSDAACALGSSLAAALALVPAAAATIAAVPASLPDRAALAGNSGFGAAALRFGLPLPAIIGLANRAWVFESQHAKHLPIQLEVHPYD